MPSQPPVTVLHPARAEALLFAWRAYAVPAACVYVQPRQRYAPSGFDVMMRGAAAALVAPGPNGAGAQGMSAIAHTAASCKQYARDTLQPLLEKTFPATFKKSMRVTKCRR